MRTRWYRRGAAAGAIALAVGLAACGGGGGTSEEAEYADALGASLQQSLAAEGLEVDESSAQCAGEAAVDIIGIEAFEAAGVTPEEIQAQADLDPIAATEPTAEQGAELADALFDCVDVGALVAGFLQDSAEAEGIDIAAEKWDCIGENVNKSEVMRASFAESLTSGGASEVDTSDPAVITELLGDCLSLEELLQIGQATGGS